MLAFFFSNFCYFNFAQQGLFILRRAIFWLSSTPTMNTFSFADFLDEFLVGKSMGKQIITQLKDQCLIECIDKKE